MDGWLNVKLLLYILGRRRYYCILCIYGHGCYYCIFNDYGFVREFGGHAEASHRVWRMYTYYYRYSLSQGHLHTDSYFDSVCFYSKCSSTPSSQAPIKYILNAIPYGCINVIDDMGHRPANKGNVPV